MFSSHRQVLRLQSEGQDSGEENEFSRSLVATEEPMEEPTEEANDYRECETV